MRHRRRSGRLGLKTAHRVAVLRNLARSLLVRQRVITTHPKAKEASRFVDRLITIAKQNSLHARRRLVSELGSGSEGFAKQLIETVAPKFSDRKGGYTRVIHYNHRPGDAAMMSLLEFTVPIVTEDKKKKKKKKLKKDTKKSDAKTSPEETKSAESKREPMEQKPETKKDDAKKETPKKGGFLGTLRKFLKGDDEGKKKNP